MFSFEEMMRLFSFKMNHNLSDEIICDKKYMIDANRINNKSAFLTTSRILCKPILLSV